MREASATVLLGRTLGLPQVLKQRSGGLRGGVLSVQTEPFERSDFVKALEHPLAVFPGECPFRPASDRDLSLRLQVEEPGGGGAFHLLNDEFRRSDAGQFIMQSSLRDIVQVERSGRQFSGGDQGAIVAQMDRGDMVRGGVIQQRFIDEGSRCQHAGDCPVHHTLGILRVLDLVADRHSEATLDQSPKISLHRVVRDPRHRHPLGPFGQRDAEHFMGGHRILVEEFVEIAHSKHQEAVGMCRLESNVLPHGRCLPHGTVEPRIDVRSGLCRIFGCEWTRHGISVPPPPTGSLNCRFLPVSKRGTRPLHDASTGVEASSGE